VVATAPSPFPVTVEIRVRGRVQGVGFRPTVWRLARELGLDGEVLNDGGGVVIRVCGRRSGIEAPLGRLEREPPPLARIERIERRALAGILPAGFRIAASDASTPSRSPARLAARN
jgi:hydrogenase maturation protein HypF